MGAFYQPKPNSESLGYKPTEFDNLSPEELDALINATGKIRVGPAQRPKPVRVVDLDAIIGGSGE
jgi:hypothetical protein